MEKAEQLLNQRNHQEAFELYEQAYQLFKEKKDDEQMLKALNQMANCRTHAAKWKEALELYNRLETEAKAFNNAIYIGNALNAQTTILSFLGQSDKVIAKSEELLKIKGLEQDFYSDAYYLLGDLYTRNGEVQKGYQMLIKAYEIDSILQDSSSLPYTCSNLALNLIAQGKLAESVKIYLNGISYVPQKDSFKLILLNRQIGVVFLKMGDLVRAKQYFNKALKASLNRGDTLSSEHGRCLFRLGDIAYNSDQMKEAEEHYKKAIQIFEKKGNTTLGFYSIQGLIGCLLKSGRLNEANSYLKESEEMLTDLQDQRFHISHLNNNIEFYLLKADYKKTHQHLKEALANITNHNEIGLQIRTYRLANDYYSSVGDYKKAYQYNITYQQLKDSVFHLQQSSILYDLEGKYQKAEQDLAIANLNTANLEKANQLNQKNRTILFGALGLLVLAALGMMSFYLYRNKRKTASELAEKNSIISKALSDKELLLKEIHHRVKNNLQVISSLLRLQSKHIKDDAALVAINEGRNRVQSMALIHQNLYQDENLIGINIKDYFEKLIKNLFASYQVSNAQIDLELDIDPITLDVDTVVPIGLIVNELVSNALKHAFPDNRPGTLKVSMKESGEGYLTLSIFDDGVGFEQQGLKKSTDSFGHKMINAFQKKLNAELNISSDSGTAIELKIQDYQKVG